MNDPAYSDGVTADSIIDMISDLGSVYKGNASQVRTPIPIEMIAPMNYISFKGNEDDHPSQLVLQKPVSPTSGNSRRSQAYNIHKGADAKTCQNPIPATITHTTISEVHDMIESFSSQNIEDDDPDAVVADDERPQSPFLATDPIQESAPVSSGRRRRRV